MTHHHEDRGPLIASWIVVVLAVLMFLAVIGILVVSLRNAHRESERRAESFELANTAVRALVLEIRAQSRLNACLTLKLAKRHGVDTSGLDSPTCKVFSNGAVVFPGAEPGNLLDSAGAQPGNVGGERLGGREPKPKPPGQTPGGPPTQPPQVPPGAGSPTPTPSPPTCIDLPLPLEDICLP